MMPETDANEAATNSASNLAKKTVTLIATV